MVGKKFNRLTVIRYYGKDRHGIKSWECKCSCGNITRVTKSNLERNHTKSCGCLMRETSRSLASKLPKRTTHGMSKYSRFYRIWSQMKARCQIKTHKSYNSYGGVGITFDESWNFFENFKADMLSSYEVHSSEFGEVNTSLDRIDNNKGYSKENCRWSTQEVQANNRKDVPYYNYKSELLTLSQLSKKYGIKYPTLKYRIRIAEWSVKDAIETPVRTR